MRSFFLSMGLIAACGGTTVIDDGSSGAGASGSTTNGTTTGATTSGVTASTTGPADCDVLSRAMLTALDEAMRCNSCDDGPDPCEYLSGQKLTDSCGCPMPVNTTNPDATAAALKIYQAWADAGCGPLECGQPCAVSNNPRCTAIGPGCDGMCMP